MTGEHKVNSEFTLADTADSKTKDDPGSFRSVEEMGAYLDAAFCSGDPAGILVALGRVARSRGVAQLARTTGLRRENFYKKLSSSGNPGFKDVILILSELGFELHVAPRRPSLPVGHSELPRIIRELRAQGVTSLAGLARSLTERGVPTARGLTVWTPPQVSRVLARMGVSLAD